MSNEQINENGLPVARSRRRKPARIARPRKPAKAALFYQSVAERLGAAPGVSQAGIATHLPLQWIGTGEDLEVAGAWLAASSAQGVRNAAVFIDRDPLGSCRRRQVEVNGADDSAGGQVLVNGGSVTNFFKFRFGSESNSRQKVIGSNLRASACERSTGPASSEST
jgi:hypothetical protein